MDFTLIQIEENDGLPTTICHECKDKATKAYDFREKSQESDTKLRGLFKKEKKEFVAEVPLFQVNVFL